MYESPHLLAQREGGYVLVLILSEPLIVKMNLYESTQHIWLIFTHTRDSAPIGGRSGKRRWAGSSVVGFVGNVRSPAAVSLPSRRHRRRGLPSRAVEQLQLYGEEEGSRG